MKRKWFMTSVLSLCTAIALSACTVTADNRSAAETIKQSLNTMVNEPVLAASSNPNDYIAGNQDVYDAILQTGSEGLNFLLNQLDSSPDNGLKEWIMARASAELLGEDNPVQDWDSGKDWLRQYNMIAADQSD
ncbi:ABC-type Fe3+-hydroxamate transport system substrate-binding protein [Paenibacillus intestini]|nr:ABC-type Fe3+-hydroxamate transport system substrate-binding protein [Paenibacillus intestini]